MKELSLNILDICENSVKAHSDFVEISLVENDQSLTITISDNGDGMTDEILSSVCDPFFTTRKTRSVGMGIPLFRFAAEQTGGWLQIESKAIGDSPETHGTQLTAFFNKTSIDYTPLGDMISTIITLIQGHPNINFLFSHRIGDYRIHVDTREMRAVLDEIPLDGYEVLSWIRENLAEQYDDYKNNKNIRFQKGKQNEIFG